MPEDKLTAVIAAAALDLGAQAACQTAVLVVCANRCLRRALRNLVLPLLASVQDRLSVTREVQMPY